MRKINDGRQVEVITGFQTKQTKEMWREIFQEEEKFLEYYYQEKILSNKVYAMKKQNKMIAMLHLTPYKLFIQQKPLHEINYMVGIGTQEPYRHQGCMKALLAKSLEDMRKGKQPFVFLMPASPKIYEPFGFQYVYNRTQYVLNENVISTEDFKQLVQENLHKKAVISQEAKKSELQAASYVSTISRFIEFETLVQKDLRELVRFTNSCLEQSADVFVYRTIKYYETLQKELISQDGNIILAKEDDRIIGYFACAYQKEELFLQEMIFPDNDTVKLFKADKMEPVIMARVTCVEEFLKLLKGGEETENTELTIRVKDSFMKENEGVYRWKPFTQEVERIVENTTVTGKAEALQDEVLRREAAQDGALQSQIHAQDTTADFAVTEADLAAFAFGYKPVEECLEVKQGSSEVHKALQQLRLLKNVCLNEIV